jgi:hypothetical protein
MNTASPSRLIRFNVSTAVKCAFGLALAAGSAVTVFGQGDIPSGTISGSGSGPYTYNLSFSDDSSATSPIGSVWYAWVPFQFFLPGTPTSATAPAGWSASIVGNSIEFTANSTANVIPAGGTLSGFSYQAAYSPATLAATANSGESDAYAGIAIESDAGKIFTVAVQPAPEPSVLALLVSGGAGLFWFARRKLSVR